MNKSKRFYAKTIAAFLAVLFTFSELARATGFETVVPSIVQDVSRFEAPLDFANLKEIHQGQNGRLIIHIQDAHSNFSGQENLAKALDFLMNKYKLNLVLSEGGQDDCSLTPLKKLASDEVWKRLARSFLIQGKISGEEYLNLTSSHPMKIMGIEDLDLYLKSVQNYALLVDQRTEILDYLKRIKNRLEKIKAKSYPEELLNYEKLIRSNSRGEFEENEKGFEELLRLAKEREINLDAYPNILKFLELKFKEKLINFDLANLEQAALFEALAKQGAGGDLERELEKANQLKNSKTSLLAYFQNTFDIAKSKGILLEKFPNLSNYKTYLEDFAGMDLERLLEEFDKVEDALYTSFLKEEDGRILRAIDRYIRLLVTAYNIQMTTKEFELFQLNEPDFVTEAYLGFINRRLAEEGYFEEMLVYEPMLAEGKKALLNFYDSVRERDFAFLKNTENILAEENQKVAVLISGGYHTQHLKKLFAEKGYSMAVLTPIVTSETNQEKYEKLLLGAVRPETKQIESVQGESRRMKSLSALEKEFVRVATEVTEFLQNPKNPGSRLVQMVYAATDEKTANEFLNNLARQRTRFEGSRLSEEAREESNNGWQSLVKGVPGTKMLTPDETQERLSARIEKLVEENTDTTTESSKDKGSRLAELSTKESAERIVNTNTEGEINEKYWKLLSEKDRLEITRLITTTPVTDKEIENERSFYYPLKNSIYVGGEKIEEVQIKGYYVVQEKLEEHKGSGAAPFNLFGPNEISPEGGMYAELARHEYEATKQLFERAGKDLQFQVKLPLAWGTFEQISFNGKKLGFVALGVPSRFKQRLDKPNIFARQKLGAQAAYLAGKGLAYLHNAGMGHGFYHPGNVSLPSSFWSKSLLQKFSQIRQSVLRGKPVIAIHDLDHLFSVSEQSLEIRETEELVKTVEFLYALFQISRIPLRLKNFREEMEAGQRLERMFAQGYYAVAEPGERSKQKAHEKWQEFIDFKEWVRASSLDFQDQEFTQRSIYELYKAFVSSRTEGSRLASVREYALHISQEAERFTNTENSFLNRHLVQWDWMQKNLLSDLIRRKEDKEINIIVLGSSTGEEIARSYFEITKALIEAGENVRDWKIQINGYDYNKDVVEESVKRLTGKRGFRVESRVGDDLKYSEELIRTLNHYRAEFAKSFEIQEKDILETDAIQTEMPRADIILLNHVLRNLNSDQKQKLFGNMDRLWPNAVLAIGDQERSLPDSSGETEHLYAKLDESYASEPKTDFNRTRYLFGLPASLADRLTSSELSGSRLAQQRPQGKEVFLKSGDKIRYAAVKKAGRVSLTFELGITTAKGEEKIYYLKIPMNENLAVREAKFMRVLTGDPIFTPIRKYLPVHVGSGRMNDELYQKLDINRNVELGYYYYDNRLDRIKNYISKSLFTVTEKISGEALEKTFAADERFSGAEALRELEAIAQMFVDFHELGVFNRDASPQEIFIDRSDPENPKPYLIDYGLAVIQNSSSSKYDQDFSLATIREAGKSALPPMEVVNKGADGSTIQSTGPFVIGHDYAKYSNVYSGDSQDPEARDIETLFHIASLRDIPNLALGFERLSYGPLIDLTDLDIQVKILKIKETLTKLHPDGVSARHILEYLQSISRDGSRLATKSIKSILNELESSYRDLRRSANLGDSGQPISTERAIQPNNAYRVYGTVVENQGWKWVVRQPLSLFNSKRLESREKMYRLSLNVKADPAVLDILDSLIATGNSNDKVRGAYKFFDTDPSDPKGWEHWQIRQDPITFYTHLDSGQTFKDKDERKKRLIQEKKKIIKLLKPYAEELKKYARNSVDSLGEEIAPGIYYSIEPLQWDVDDLLAELEEKGYPKTSPEYKAVLNFLTGNENYNLPSYGQLAAAQNYVSQLSGSRLAKELGEFNLDKMELLLSRLFEREQELKDFKEFLEEYLTDALAVDYAGEAFLGEAPHLKQYRISARLWSDRKIILYRAQGRGKKAKLIEIITLDLAELKNLPTLLTYRDAYSVFNQVRRKFSKNIREREEAIEKNERAQQEKRDRFFSSLAGKRYAVHFISRRFAELIQLNNGPGSIDFESYRIEPGKNENEFLLIFTSDDFNLELDRFDASQFLSKLIRFKDYTESVQKMTGWLLTPRVEVEEGINKIRNDLNKLEQSENLLDKAQINQLIGQIHLLDSWQEYQVYLAVNEADQKNKEALDQKEVFLNWKAVEDWQAWRQAQGLSQLMARARRLEGKASSSLSGTRLASQQGLSRRDFLRGGAGIVATAVLSPDVSKAAFFEPGLTLRERFAKIKTKTGDSIDKLWKNIFGFSQINENNPEHKSFIELAEGLAQKITEKTKTAFQKLNQFLTNRIFTSFDPIKKLKLLQFTKRIIDHSLDRVDWVLATLSDLADSGILSVDSLAKLGVLTAITASTGGTAHTVFLTLTVLHQLGIIDPKTNPISILRDFVARNPETGKRFSVGVIAQRNRELFQLTGKAFEAASVLGALDASLGPRATLALKIINELQKENYFSPDVPGRLQYLLKNVLEDNFNQIDAIAKIQGKEKELFELIESLAYEGLFSKKPITYLLWVTHYLRGPAAGVDPGSRILQHMDEKQRELFRKLEPYRLPALVRLPSVSGSRLAIAAGAIETLERLDSEGRFRYLRDIADDKLKEMASIDRNQFKDLVNRFIVDDNKGAEQTDRQNLINIFNRMITNRTIARYLRDAETEEAVSAEVNQLIAENDAAGISFLISQLSQIRDNPGLESKVQRLAAKLRFAESQTTEEGSRLSKGLDAEATSEKWENRGIETYGLDEIAGIQEAYRKIFEQVIPASNLSQKSILEIGSGRGVLIEYALDRGVRSFTALDINQKMLDAAQERLNRKFSKEDLEARARLIKADMFELGQALPSTSPENKFDYILIPFVLNFYDAEARTKLFESLKAYLNKNGKLVIITRTHDEVHKDGQSIPRRVPIDYRDLLSGYSERLETAGYEKPEFTLLSVETDDDWGAELNEDAEVIVNHNVAIQTTIRVESESAVDSEVERFLSAGTRLATESVRLIDAPKIQADKETARLLAQIFQATRKSFRERFHFLIRSIFRTASIGFSVEEGKVYADLYARDEGKKTPVLRIELTEALASLEAEKTKLQPVAQTLSAVQPSMDLVSVALRDFRHSKRELLKAFDAAQNGQIELTTKLVLHLVVSAEISKPEVEQKIAFAGIFKSLFRNGDVRFVVSGLDGIPIEGSDSISDLAGTDYKTMYEGELSQDLLELAKQVKGAGAIFHEALRVSDNTHRVIPEIPMHVAALLVAFGAEEEQARGFLQRYTQSALSGHDIRQYLADVPDDADVRLYRDKGLIIKAIVALEINKILESTRMVLQAIGSAA